jgi:hypothetical protein
MKKLRPQTPGFNKTSIFRLFFLIVFVFVFLRLSFSGSDRGIHVFIPSFKNKQESTACPLFRIQILG